MINNATTLFRGLPQTARSTDGLDYCDLHHDDDEFHKRHRPRLALSGAPAVHRSMLGTRSSEFPHKWAVMFLIAIGFLQFNDSLQDGYWHARTPEFFQQKLVSTLEWLRLPGDVLFIVGGILPVVYLALRMFAHRNRTAPQETGESPGAFTTKPT